MGEIVLMDAATLGYARVDGALWCEEVPLSRIAERAGTPCYVYSAGMIRAQYTCVADAFAGMNVQLHYSVKANSNRAILEVLRAMGAGVDIVSGGELHRSMLAGFQGSDVVFSGVGKTASELMAAVRAGVKAINVESVGELQALNQIAEEVGVVAPVALRVNPDVSVETPHPYTRTGQHGMKFGIPDDQVLSVARSMRQMRGVTLVGMAAHLGSQVSQSEPYSKTAARLVALCTILRDEGVDTLRYLDIGGGFAVSYADEAPIDLSHLAQTLRPIVQASGLQLLIEPGRFLVANAGTLLTRVIYRKHSGGKEIVITDAGMNDLIRPSLYKAYHGVEAIDTPTTAIKADVVGPICESGDFFAIDRDIGDVGPGDVIAVRGAGAYSFVMASNYNSRPRPAEVLVDGARFAIVTARESYDDLVRQESLTPVWSDI